MTEIDLTWLPVNHLVLAEILETAVRSLSPIVIQLWARWLYSSQLLLRPNGGGDMAAGF